MAKSAKTGKTTPEHLHEDIPTVASAFRYEDGYTLVVTDLGSRGVKLELFHNRDGTAAVILPPEKVRQCARWLLRTIAQNELGLPLKLSELLTRIDKEKCFAALLRRGDKKVLKESLRLLRRCS